ncbi:beta-galactosidase GalA [Alkalitalea saponilacus]|uniref:Beta-galactosidase n=1 Tax=Alkalitalea saponilacus TaxID=889453 RepID=A0A1T5CGZ9_9BACT|nr:beta-galactosidase GalA [Alkalitalea saponilacus]ASB49868.1 beta-galactosidase [Alkalitalea saponilacus]SKB58772.1 beta-galactosidase [Alkalitalea saponilacus]
MNRILRKMGVLLAVLILSLSAIAESSPRERLLMNYDWKFAFGHATNIEKDFNVGTSYFTYLAKAGYGDGAAAADFDDRSWRLLDLPHDWAVEAEFHPDASHSHGYKAVGPGFPESSVGWYRRSFYIPEEDLGKRIFIEFEGVFRDARVWVNGFYCGNEPSGYTSFSYDVTEYLNYGGNNVVSIRVDACMEEGWFYEGAGVYRHVHLTKTDPLYVPQYGTYVTTQVDDSRSEVTARITVMNKNLEPASFQIENKIIDAEGRVVASGRSGIKELKSMFHGEYPMILNVDNPRLWDIDDPHLYQLVTNIYQNEVLVDEFKTTFGIRTIEWTPDRGFFLNGRHVKIKGTNNHQNHAGVGTAIPDALHEWRIRQLQYMGNNTYRMAHYPPSPALLEACDRMGMLVVNENRIMGTTDEILDHLRRLMIRDRNHPSVILWSIGNEEWMIEGNEKGARIALNMQAFAKKYDVTRPINVAVSGTWGGGISSVIEVMGYNYLRHGDTDKHYAANPWQASLGTEEGSTNTTRGIYFDDFEKQHLAAYDRPTNGFIRIRDGWKHYAERDYLAGMCIWTGFDYRGESTPFEFPSVVSYFGMMDLCGFPKDNVYYLKSWWSNDPVLHVFPHWNWPGREGEEIDVWVYSNFEEIELFLNGESLGRQTMKPNDYLSWMVEYQPGTVKAVAYENGEVAMTTEVSTTGAPSTVALVADRTEIRGDRADLSVITVRVEDENGALIPDAMHDVVFDISGPGRIIGVGNGDPVSHEPCKFVETIKAFKIENIREKPLSDVRMRRVLAPGFDCSSWKPGLQGDGLAPGTESVPMVVRGTFNLSNEELLKGKIQWMYKSIGHNQSVYVNGTLVGENLSGDVPFHQFDLSASELRTGVNVVTMVANPYVKTHVWNSENTDPGLVRVEIPANQWRRRVFNGLAQVLVQSTGEAGDIILSAKSEGLKRDDIVITALESDMSPVVK